jgi:adenosylhomocysteine nucleosidase
MNIVVLISANAEWRAIKELYMDHALTLRRSPLGEFFDVPLGDSHSALFFHGGWGKISAAATAQYAIDHFRPDLLVNLGTCGGLQGRITPGAVILVERTIVYDIIEQMGDADEALRFYSTDIDLSWLQGRSPHPVLRGLLVSADRDIVIDDIPMLVEKFGAVAADWESGAIAWVAARNHMRLLILRGVTDLVGADGGEAYGDLGLFHKRTASVMAELIRQLPDWID